MLHGTCTQEFSLHVKTNHANHPGYTFALFLDDVLLPLVTALQEYFWSKTDWVMALAVLLSTYQTTGLSQSWPVKIVVKQVTGAVSTVALDLLLAVALLVAAAVVVAVSHAEDPAAAVAVTAFWSTCRFLRIYESS